MIHHDVGLLLQFAVLQFLKTSHSFFGSIHHLMHVVHTCSLVFFSLCHHIVSIKLYIDHKFYSPNIINLIQFHCMKFLEVVSYTLQTEQSYS